MSRVHRVADGSKFVSHWKIFDYDEIAAILRTGDTAFFEETKEQPLKRQTIWKASRKLSGMLGKKVKAVYGSIKLNGDTSDMMGYLFSVVEEKK